MYTRREWAQIWARDIVGKWTRRGRLRPAMSRPYSYGPSRVRVTHGCVRVYPFTNQAKILSGAPAFLGESTREKRRNARNSLPVPGRDTVMMWPVAGQHPKAIFLTYLALWYWRLARRDISNGSTRTSTYPLQRDVRMSGRQEGKEQRAHRQS